MYDHEDCPNQHENSLNPCDKNRHFLLSLIESQLKLIRIFNWQKATVEQMLELKEVNKSTRAKFWVSQSGIQVEKLAHINKDGDR